MKRLKLREQEEMKGIRQLSKELGVREKDLKKALVENNILIDNGSINPLAIELGIANQIGVYVNGINRNKFIYSPDVIDQIVKGKFKQLDIKEIELPF